MNDFSLDQDFLAEYIRNYSSKLVEERLGSEKSITGKEILKLSTSRQINLFVIKILFQEWQEEMKQLESPYFDYKNPDVRKAMVNFMNVLSQNINIAHHDLVPLVRKSMDQTFLLLTDPTDFLKYELELKHNPPLSDKIITQLTKYSVYLKAELREFLSEVEGDSTEMVLQKARYFFEGHQAENYLQSFLTDLSDIEPVSLEDILKPTDESGDPPFETEVAAEPESDLESSFPSEAEMPGPDDEPSPSADEKEKPDPVESNPPVEDDDEEGEMKILNDQFEVGAKTLADLHEEKKIDSIMEAISINHRYMFLQELFDGDNDQFQKAIQKIEQSNSFDEAVEMLVQGYSKDYFWDMNSEEVKEFLKVVFRYFR